MKIEEVSAPCMSVADAVEVLREAGLPMSVNRMRAGICQGVYPFGECVERGTYLKNDCYTVYTALLREWMRLRNCRRDGGTVGVTAWKRS